MKTGKIFRSFLMYSSLFLGGSHHTPSFQKKRNTAYPWQAWVKMEHEWAIKITFYVSTFGVPPLIAHPANPADLCKVAEGRSQFRVTLKGRSWTVHQFIRVCTHGQVNTQPCSHVLCRKKPGLLTGDWISELCRGVWGWKKVDMISETFERNEGLSLNGPDL